MDLYKLDEVADMLKVTTQTVRNMVKRGDLVAVFPQTGEMGRPKTMITSESVVGYIKSQGGKA